MRVHQEGRNTRLSANHCRQEDGKRVNADGWTGGVGWVVAYVWTVGFISRSPIVVGQMLMLHIAYASIDLDIAAQIDEEDGTCSASHALGEFISVAAHHAVHGQMRLAPVVVVAFCDTTSAYYRLAAVNAGTDVLFGAGHSDTNAGWLLHRQKTGRDDAQAQRPSVP